jgi:GPI-anchor transamidase subunit GAA1
MFLATLATVNFSLSFIIGLLSSPLTFIGISPAETAADPPSKPSQVRRVLENMALQALSPPSVLFIGCLVAGVDVQKVLMEAAFGWRVWGLWTQVIVWCVWWPAWLAGGIAVAPEVL